jgi:hypothetical protein
VTKVIRSSDVVSLGGYQGRNIVEDSLFHSWWGSPPPTSLFECCTNRKKHEAMEIDNRVFVPVVENSADSV